MPDPTEQLNALEFAVLQRMAASNPFLVHALADLHVTSREFTGVGTFTNFVEEADRSHWDRHVNIDATIELPGIEYGLDAILFCRGDTPVFLELVTSGEPWDGTIDRFGLKPR